MNDGRELLDYVTPVDIVSLVRDEMYRTIHLHHLTSVSKATVTFYRIPRIKFWGIREKRPTVARLHAWIINYLKPSSRCYMTMNGKKRSSMFFLSLNKNPIWGGSRRRILIDFNVTIKRISQDLQWISTRNSVNRIFMTQKEERESSLKSQSN